MTKKAAPVKRISLDEYFLKIASVVAERATCRRHHMGAIAVRDKHILTTGYNGAPAGAKDCLELGCLRDELNITSGTQQEICRGISLEGATVYCTHTPCVLCAKMMVNARIARSVSFGKYNDERFIDLFKEAGIKVDILKKPGAQISFLD